MYLLSEENMPASLSLAKELECRSCPAHLNWEMQLNLEFTQVMTKTIYTAGEGKNNPTFCLYLETIVGVCFPPVKITESVPASVIAHGYLK